MGDRPERLRERFRGSEGVSETISERAPRTFESTSWNGELVAECTSQRSPGNLSLASRWDLLWPRNALNFCRKSQEWPRQTKPKKGQLMNFSQGHSGTKIQCESCLFRWTFRIFFISSAWGRGRVSPMRQERGGGGVDFLLKNAKRVGLSGEKGGGGRGAGRVSAGNLVGGGGGWIFFLGGLNSHPVVFQRKNTRIHTKMGEIHELFVLALSLVWFAWATPDVCASLPWIFRPLLPLSERRVFKTDFTRQILCFFLRGVPFAPVCLPSKSSKPFFC